MKNKSKVFFLTMLLFTGTFLVACDSSNSKDDKYVAKMIQDTKDLDETYHLTPEQERKLQESYRNAQKKLQQADSLNQTKRVYNSNLSKGNER